MHAIAILGGGTALAVLLMAAAILGGPVWGIVPVMLVLAGWVVVSVLLALSQIDMLAMIIAAAVVVAASVLVKGGGAGEAMHG